MYQTGIQMYTGNKRKLKLKTEGEKGCFFFDIDFPVNRLRREFTRH